jgi:hypothetical protein
MEMKVKKYVGIFKIFLNFMNVLSFWNGNKIQEVCPRRKNRKKNFVPAT